MVSGLKVVFWLISRHLHLTASNFYTYGIDTWANTDTIHVTLLKYKYLFSSVNVFHYIFVSLFTSKIDWENLNFTVYKEEKIMHELQEWDFYLMLVLMGHSVFTYAYLVSFLKLLFSTQNTCSQEIFFFTLYSIKMK